MTARSRCAISTASVHILSGTWPDRAVRSALDAALSRDLLCVSSLIGLHGAGWRHHPGRLTLMTET